jgi:UDP-N-acetyl-D-galactosamine dehydrogenase
MTERIAVIGLGYVGLPVATAFARELGGTVGFDVDEQRIRELIGGYDRTGELTRRDLESARLSFTTDPDDLQGSSLFVVTVPTPIDGNRQPDLRPLARACETIGPRLGRTAVVVFESTVYPGVTEEFCGPILGRLSGLRPGIDFGLGYSPERINPGDRAHRLETVVKVISASDSDSLARLERVYGAIVPAGVYRASSIKVAEAAKVIENTQRDLNIALMNELALIFDRLGIPTRDVLEAARTKWNFLSFVPGLVGGHCIGVDPYYLTAKAESLGYNPQIILAGRRINDGMGTFIAQRLVKLLVQCDLPVKQARIGILGLTFKENVPDLRNSRVPDIVAELAQFGIAARVHDPLADPEEAEEVYGLSLTPLEALRDLEALVLAVPHEAYLAMLPEGLLAALRPGGIVVDVKSVLRPGDIPEDLRHWSL